MKSRNMYIILSVLITLVAVIGLGFLGCWGSNWFLEAQRTGFLVRWTSIGTPPSKAVSIQIAASEWGSGKTVVKTADGKFFEYKPGLFAKWVETSWPYRERTELSPRCPGFDRPRPSLPHEIIDCRGSFTWEWQDTEEFYAILDDGSVWRWSFGYGLLNALITITIATILGGIGGYFLSRRVRKIMVKHYKF